MRVLRRSVVVVALATFLIPSLPASAEVPVNALRQSIEKAVATVKPALVQIFVVESDYREGRESKYQISGSGAVITPEGHVITNHHVAGHAKRIVCVFDDEEEISAILVGKDPLTDIAVIKLQPKTPREFATVPFGDSNAVRVGDQVLAMGSPYALSQSVTLGIISNTEMIMPERSRRSGGFQLDGEDVGTLVRWFSHDAAIYGGNSGGPLVDLEGAIVGINELSVGGVGGAIPGNLAKAVAEELMAKGKIERAWLGLDVQPRLKYGEHENGILVSGVLADSPASEAGLEAGDVITSVNGIDVNVQFDVQLPDFHQIVADLPIGNPVPLNIQRGNEPQTISITPVEREPFLPEESEHRAWGLTVRNLSERMAKELKRETTDGVLVTSVRPGGPAGASKPQIKYNDVLVSINGKAITNVADLVAATVALQEGATDPVPTLTGFERKTGQFLTVVNVGLKELQDPGLEVKKAWLAVETQVITRDVAKLLGDEELKGFRITHVFKSSSAEKAGLKVGDLIHAVDDQPLVATALEHYEELPTLIRQYRSGDTVTLSISRDGAPQSIPVELVRAPKLDREMMKYRNDEFEFTVRDITFFDKAEESWETAQTGVLVEEVIPGGWAALGQLSVGDLLMTVDGTEVKSVMDVENLLGNVAETHPKTVVLKVLRGIHTLFIEIEPKWS